MGRMGIFETIKQRRSVRNYKDKKVEEEKIKKVIDAARWAPSWANTQCWSFIVVEDEEVKAGLAGALSENNPATDAVREAPVVIVGCAEKEVSGFKKGEAVTGKGDWFMFDLGLAMQNLMLAAESLGLGTVQVGFLDADEVENILEIPDNVTVVTMTPLGYPEEKPSAPPRKDLDEIMFREEYGK